MNIEASAWIEGLQDARLLVPGSGVRAWAGRLSVPESALQDWTAGSFRLLRKAPRPLSEILRCKANRRPGTRRFFGEAYVAAKMTDADPGWYTSFKWLTSPIWSGQRTLDDTYREKFRSTLQESFGERRLERLQKRARAFSAQLGGKKPVAPDLWLTVGSDHRFIEVKLLPDTIDRRQLAGLALIAKYLDGVSVGVVYVHTDRHPPNFGELDEFPKLYRQV
jgi:hypothetical protein